MRRDRREEIIAQMEAEKRAEKKRRGNGFCRFLSTLYTLLAAAFVALLIKLDALPAKYLYAGIAVLVIASVFIVPVMFSKRGKKGRKIGASVVALLLIGVFGVGTWYLTDTLHFIDTITQVKQETEDYYVVVPQEALFEDINGIDGQIVGTHMTSDLRYSEAKAKLQEEVQVTYAYEAEVKTLIEKLLAGEYQAIFLPAATYDNLKTEENADSGIDADLDTLAKVLATISIPIETEDQTSAVDVTKESFNVYISGSDMSGSIDVTNRTDVNMIATVNPRTHELLLTSIPRDYYVTLPSKNAKDKLTHSSLYGMQESIGALENAFGIDINYYLRVNYSTIIKLVDAMGGTENPASLGCDFYELEDGELATFFTPKEIHEGHDGIMHGGLSGAILDEVMGRCNFVEAADGTLYNPYVTGEMTVRYYLPIRVGTKMRAFGRVDRSEGRKNFNSGEILDADGVVVAEAAGIYIRTNFIDDQNVPEGEKRGILPLTAEDPAEL